MITATRILTLHAWFATIGRSWTSPSSGGPVARETLPPAAATDTNSVPIWFNLGIIDSGSHEGKEERIEVWKGNPGRKSLYAEYATKPDSITTMTVKETSPLLFQLLHGTLDLSLVAATNAIQYNEAEGKYHLVGFLKTQAYDQDNVLVNTKDVFGRLSISGAFQMNGENIDLELEHRMWISSHNSGILLPA